MTESLKNLLSGAGSIVDVLPRADYRDYIPTETAEERMRGHWERTGEHIQKAMNRFSYEQQEEK